LYLEKPTNRLEFRCIGLIKARYESLDPDDKFNYKGNLVTPDGVKIPATVINRNLISFLKANPEMLERDLAWTVYAKTHPSLKVQIKHVRPELDLEQDEFSLRGVVINQDRRNNAVELLIKRNKKISQEKKEEIKNQPFKVKVYGDLMNRALNQFWEIEAIREKDYLVIDNANFISVMEESYRDNRGGGGRRNNNYRDRDNRGGVSRVQGEIKNDAANNQRRFNRPPFKAPKAVDNRKNT